MGEPSSKIRRIVSHRRPLHWERPGINARAGPRRSGRRLDRSAPPTPQKGIPAGVEAGQDDDRLIDDSKEESVGKPMNEGSAGLSSHHWIGLRNRQDGLHGGSNLFEKLFPQTLP